MRSRLAAVALVLAGALLAGRPAAAAEPTGPAATATRRAAEADAAKAARALAARDYGGAAVGYERAFRQLPNPKWLFGAASARRKNGDLAQAANGYARYLAEAPATAPQRGAAKKELATLAPKLGRLAIEAEGATVTVDGEEIASSIFGSVYVSAGTHLVEARFGDETVKESATAQAGRVSTVALARAASSAPPPAEEPPPPPAEEKPVPRERSRPLPPLAVWIGAGVTVVAGALTIASGLDVLGQKETFDAERSRQNLADGKDKQLRTNVLIAVTGGAAVLTGVAAIWFVDWRRRGDDASVKVGAGPTSIVVRGSF
ncbi:MAG: hypothetical protein KF764_18230 [Labilithrix sp.]|nr:hypothetical protein [Labilithrix sp.]